jgi:transcriptional regulator with GAF, ATPase, and Fis domain
LIEEFAPFDISVLIQGETGTGKELVASAVRGLGGRKGRPYEVVNCATLTRELAGSELFGHVATYAGRCWSALRSASSSAAEKGGRSEGFTK